MNLSTIKIAWRNLGRNKRRTAVAICAIALGQLTLIFVNCMMAGMFDDVLKTVTGPLVGHVQIQHSEWQEKRGVDMYIDNYAETRKTLEAREEIKSVAPRIMSGVLVIPGAKSEEPSEAEAGMVLGIDLELESKDRGILATLKEGDLPGPGQVVIGQVLASRLGIKKGDTIAAIGVDVDEYPTDALFEVSAVIRGATEIVNRLGLVMSLEDAWEFLAMEDTVHQMVVHSTDLKKATTLAEDIRVSNFEMRPMVEIEKELEEFIEIHQEKRISELMNADSNLDEKKAKLLAERELKKEFDDGEELEILPWNKAVPAFEMMITMKDKMDGVFLVVLLLAAVAGIANTMLMSTFERTREFGMMLAIGTEPKRVVWMVLYEALILGLIGVAVGTLIGVPLVYYFGSVGINYASLGGIDADSADFAYNGVNFSYIMYPKFEFKHVINGTIGVMITSLIAAVWPAMISARLEPVEAMRS